MRKIADYELGELIGAGNHGRFYKAKPPRRLQRDDEWVAVKVLDKHATADEFRRFANELRIFAAVDSHHLESPIDAGQQDAILFYVIEYYPMGSLAAAPQDFGEAARVRAVADAARGAHALHEVGVAHRDIKPANILLHADGARLADLGLAQVLNPGVTVTGTGPIGSLDCMDPERVLGHPASRATDIWELSATLHKALTGRSVFGEIPGNDIIAALNHVTTTEPAIDEAVPDRIRDVLTRGLARSEETRPSTALELAQLLEDIS
jgi:serine/threonine protein kinase